MLLATSAEALLGCWNWRPQGPTAGPRLSLPPVSLGKDVLRAPPGAPDGGTDAGLERHAGVDVVELQSKAL